LLAAALVVGCSSGANDTTTIDSQLVSALADQGVKCLPHMPPPFGACEGLDGGAACTFSDDGRTVSGVCHMTGTGRFVCATDEDEEHVPGVGAVTACVGLTAGADCVVPDDDDHDADGGDDVLACVPQMPMHDRHAMGPHGGPLGAAFDACNNLATGATCTFSWKEHGLAGTCQATPSGAVICAPACHQ
jgi:hypothetical protein